jgi:hypothetical protein
MADGAEQDGVEATQVVDGRFGQHLAGAEVAIATEVEVGRLVAEVTHAGGGVEHLDGLGGHLGPGPVSSDDGDLVHG